MKNNILIFLFCILSVSSHGQRPSSTTLLRKFDILAQEIDEINFSNGMQARKLIDDLYKIADSHADSSELRIECLYREAALNYAQGESDSTLNKRIQSLLNTDEVSNNPFYKVLLDYARALVQFTEGNYANTFTMALQVMEEFKALNDSLFTAKSLMLLGRICNSIESYHLTEDYYVQALTYVNSSQIEYYQIKSNIYNIHALQKRQESAIDSLISLIPIIEQRRYNGLLATNYLNIGAFYFLQADYEKSYKYYMIAQKIEPTIDNKRFSISLQQNIGLYYQVTGDLKKSYQYFQKAKSLADDSGSLDLVALNLRALASLHEMFHNNDSAYFYLKAYNQTKNRMAEANPIEAYQAYIAVVLKDSQKELKIKGQEALLNERRLIVVVISFVAIILLVASWLIILYQQKRHSRQQALLKEAENRDLEERLQNKQQIEQLQKEHIETQNREMASYSLALSTKNDIFQQIATAIQRLPEDPSVIDEIRQVIKNNAGTDKAWDDFILHFDKVHPSFFYRIKALNPDLSENDLRLCSYIRIGMPTKQIAQMLNVSPDSIRTQRYRIRKKLGFAEDQSLDDFIRNI